MSREKQNGYTITFEENKKEREDQFVVCSYAQKDIGSHRHDFFELAYVTGGRAEHALDGGVQIPVCQGDYFIIDYGSMHRYSGSRDFTLINCLFLPEVIDQTLAGTESFDEILRVSMVRYYRRLPDLVPVNRIFHDDDGEIRACIEKMKWEYEHKAIGYQEIFRCQLSEILIRMVRNIVSEREAPAERMHYSGPVRDAIAYLGKHYAKQSVIGDFCGTYHYSRQYISRRFHQETGRTAMKYLQDIRLEKSCELLVGSDLQIQEIAAAVGYEDLKYFGQLFKQTLKMTPGAYRRLANGSAECGESAGRSR